MSPDDEPQRRPKSLPLRLHHQSKSHPQHPPFHHKPIPEVAGDALTRIDIRSLSQRCGNIENANKHMPHPVWMFRLFEIRATSPPYKILLYPPFEVVSDFTIKDGSWDLELITALQPYITPHPGQIIVNAGGNIGTLAIYYAKAGFEVFAMEPFSSNFLLMNCSAVLNGVADKMHLYQAALGPKHNDRICMSHNRPKNLGAVEVQTAAAARCSHPTLSLHLGDFIQERKEQFKQRFLLLLLDLEAYEPVVLRTLQTILADADLRPRYIVLEFNCPRWEQFNKLKNCTEVTDMVLR
ncbi:hypothetical protein EON64_16690 [archaeon]|nr:MAG: hypothetical protein EON64_16690 [archaeon]